MSDSSQDWGSQPARPAPNNGETGPKSDQPAEVTPPEAPSEAQLPEILAEEDLDVEVEDRGTGGAATLPRPAGPGFWQRLEPKIGSREDATARSEEGGGGGASVEATGAAVRAAHDWLTRRREGAKRRGQAGGASIAATGAAIRAAHD